MATGADRVRLAVVARILGRLMAAYVRLVAATCRMHGPPVTQEQVVLAFWHEYNLAAAIAARRLRPGHRHVSFSTRGFRGIVMNSMLAALDAGAVPLPAETRRAEAAQVSLRMAALAAQGISLAVSPDGPGGPYRKAKPGALIVARAAALPVQPWAVAVRPSLRLRARWDRQLVPLPFARLRVEQGPALHVGAHERLRSRLTELQAELERVSVAADRREGRRD